MKKKWWRYFGGIGGVSLIIAQTAWTRQYNIVALICLICGILAIATYFYMEQGDK